jgi:hypothetical protein
VVETKADLPEGRAITFTNVFADVGVTDVIADGLI